MDAGAKRENIGDRTPNKFSSTIWGCISIGSDYAGFMPSPHPIDKLYAISRRFGPEAVEEKLRWLRKIPTVGPGSARRIVRLHDTLYFMLAYPDNTEVLGAVRAGIAALRSAVAEFTDGDIEHYSLLNTGLPGSCNSYAYSYAVLERLVKMFPGDLEFDWESIADDSSLGDAMILTVATSEVRGLEDEYLTLREWLCQCRPRSQSTDLEVVLKLFRESTLDPKQQMHVFETCDPPVAYHLRAPGTGRCEISLSPKRVFYQRKPIIRETFRLGPKIARPLDKHRRLDSKTGRRMLDLSLRCLCSRNLEIYPLIYANPADVTIVECGRGIRVMLAGMLPEFRPALESDFFFLILKNGVPIAYGPASIFLGCCEMGINLFPEFRGGEIRYIYAQFMRSLYHLAGVRYFFLTSYGMGEGNPEALKSGAFWFYRKLGFRASNPEVEALAREEEALMRQNPGYRCSTATLRKLSHTEAFFDLSRGACRPTNFEAIGRAATRWIADRFDGDRTRAQRSGTRGLAGVLGVGSFADWSPEEKHAISQLAPVLCLLPRLSSWTAREKKALVSVIRAKGAPRQFAYVRRVDALQRVKEGLESVCAELPDEQQ